MQTRNRSGSIIVPMTCDHRDHLHDATTHYDHAEKVLTFVLVCPICGTEQVVGRQHYEPRFQPIAA